MLLHKTDNEDRFWSGMGVNDANEWGFFVRSRFGKKRSYLLQCVIIPTGSQKWFFSFSSFVEDFSFLSMCGGGSENAQRRTIRGRSRAINLDSFLICKTSSCSMYVPPPPTNHPMSPIIQFREASDHNKINLSLFSQIGTEKFHPSSIFWWIFVSISSNHAKAFFDAFEPIRRWRKLWDFAIGWKVWGNQSKTFANLHLWSTQVTAPW